PPSGHQAVLLLLTARLASSRLLAAWLDGPPHRPAGERRLEPLPRFSRRPAHRVAHELRRSRGYLVRWHVGQTGGRLAPAPDLCADSPAAAGGTHRAQSPQGAAPR